MAGKSKYMPSSNKPLSVVQSKAALDSGEITARDLVHASLDAISQTDSSRHAFLEVFEEQALARAQEVDDRRAKKEKLGALAGIPIAIKDNICTVEGHTRAAAKMLKRFAAPFDATVVSRLKREGSILIGKTNLDEFAMGSSTEYSAFGPTHNPWNIQRVPGGSSGGGAAAVASGQVPAAIGTDTGGSVRQPAALCGIVGVRPTYGRISRFGLVAYGSSLDQAGILTRTVQDAALLLELIAGQDEWDATTSPEPVGEYVAATGRGAGNITIGMPKEFFDEGIDSEIRDLCRTAVQDLEKMGARIQEISLPLTAAAIPVYYLLAKAEASTNLARFDGLRYSPMDLASADLIKRYEEARGAGFGPEVKRAILMGTYALSSGYYDAWYKQASKVRTLIRQEYERALADVDVIAGPTSPEVAWLLGSKMSDPLQMYLADALTVPTSVAGVPAISLPCGFSQNMPVGLQLIAAHWQEEKMFQVAAAYEQAHEWWRANPPTNKTG